MIFDVHSVRVSCLRIILTQTCFCSNDIFRDNQGPNTNPCPYDDFLIQEDFIVLTCQVSSLWARKINVRYSNNIDPLKVRSKNLDSFFSCKVRSLPPALLQEIYFSCLILYIFHINKYHAKSNIIHNGCIYSIYKYVIFINKFPYMEYLL